MMKKFMLAVSAIALGLSMAAPASATGWGGNGGPKGTKASISAGSQGGAGNVGGGTAKGNVAKVVVTGSKTNKSFSSNTSVTYNNGKTDIRGSTSGHTATDGFSAAGAIGTHSAEASTYEEGGASSSSELEVKN